MVDNVTQLPVNDGPPGMRGPDRVGSSVIIEERLIPKLHMHDRGETIEFVLDERLSFEFPANIAWLAGCFAANAMAIGAGYPHLTADEKTKGFAPQCFGITLDRAD